jgi:hypothetical protein
LSFYFLSNSSRTLYANFYQSYHSLLHVRERNDNSVTVTSLATFQTLLRPWDQEPCFYLHRAKCTAQKRLCNLSVCPHRKGFTDSDCPFGIFKLFIRLPSFIYRTSSAWQLLCHEELMNYVMENCRFLRIPPLSTRPAFFCVFFLIKFTMKSHIY